MKLEELATNCGEWLRGTGPETDVVVSSRIRIARNLAEFPFIRRCTESDKQSIVKLVESRLDKLPTDKAVEFLDVDSLTALDRQFLMERQLISRELNENEGARGVAVDPNEQFSIMVNEEDHLRIQVIRSGLDLKSTWDTVDKLDNALESTLTYAFHEQLGYLTACPTNVGTGLRVSVMLHLPALVLTKQIDKVFRSLTKINVAVRGLFGEGSKFAGDFYQISNQITLGKSEAELIDQVKDVVPLLIDYERKARKYLLDATQADIHDEISRSFGLLCTAKKISSEETMHYLSKVRLGVNLGLIKDVDVPTLNKLFIHTQPAHLQKLRGKKLRTGDRNIERAAYLQKYLTGNDTEGK